MLPKNFYKNVEIRGELRHILYGDTDSLFLTIPYQSDKKMSAIEKWDTIDPVVKSINDLIIDYTSSVILKKCNIQPKHNHTFFKTEFLMDGILFINVKKNYAYKVLVKEGKVVEPFIEYKNLEVARSNVSILTKEILKYLVEDVVLNNEVSKDEKLNKLVESMKRFKDEFLNCFETYELEKIAVPGKWSKDKFMINGMSIYNHIMDEKVFTPGSSGKFIYTKFNNPYLFKDNFDITKINGIALPYIYDKDKLKREMIKYEIEFDHKTQWGKIFTATCVHVINAIRQNYDKETN